MESRPSEEPNGENRVAGDLRHLLGTSSQNLFQELRSLLLLRGMCSQYQGQPLSPLQGTSGQGNRHHSSLCRVSDTANGARERAIGGVHS